MFRPRKKENMLRETLVANTSEIRQGWGEEKRSRNSSEGHRATRGKTRSSMRKLRTRFQKKKLARRGEGASRNSQPISLGTTRQDRCKENKKVTRGEGAEGKHQLPKAKVPGSSPLREWRKGLSPQNPSTRKGLIKGLGGGGTTSVRLSLKRTRSRDVPEQCYFKQRKQHPGERQGGT